jgi:hypothetical protein
MTRNESNQVQNVASTPGPTRTARWRTIAIGAIFVVCVAYAVLEGIHSRVEAKAELHQVRGSSKASFLP